MREEGFFIEGGQGRLSEKVIFELKPENENYSDIWERIICHTFHNAWHTLGSQ